MEGLLSNYLSLIKPYICNSFTNKNYFKQLNKISDYISFPLSSKMGFEIHLSEEINPILIDLAICIEKDILIYITKIEQNKFLTPKLKTMCPEIILIWTYIWNLIKCWNTSKLQKYIDKLWLEFDSNKIIESNIIPSLFISIIDIKTQKIIPLIDYIFQNINFEILNYKNNIINNLTKIFNKLITLLPPNTNISQIGFMLSRASLPTRIIFSGFSSSENIITYLKKIKWKGNIKILQIFLNNLYTLCDCIDFSLDIIKNKVETLGFECFFYYNLKSIEKIKFFLYYLLSSNLIKKNYIIKILQWIGISNESFPNSYEEFYLVRKISHFKITYSLNDLFTAKAYIGFYKKEKTKPNYTILFEECDKGYYC